MSRLPFQIPFLLFANGFLLNPFLVTLQLVRALYFVLLFSYAMLNIQTQSIN